MSHPYRDTPPARRWRAAMAATPPGEIDPVGPVPFRIAASDRVATAGSCFAQHIGRGLRARGFRPLVTESAHPILPPETAEAFGYGVYTARYGNLYTPRQALQLLRRAYGRFAPAEDVWLGEGGRAFDPFRPAVQPGGFATREELEADRVRHLAAVRAMFESADVLVFTLGLTECWVSRVDGAVFPVCPGVLAGEFDPDRHAFRNLDADETSADLEALIEEARAVNPALRVVLTVSPVPLAATAEPRHVWTSTTWSKAVLRVAAETATRRAGVAYFPSYEVITSPAARGAYFAEDLRSVTPEGVDHVMRLFFRHFVEAPGEPTPAPAAAPATDAGWLAGARAATDVVCEEAALDPD